MAGVPEQGRCRGRLGDGEEPEPAREMGVHSVCLGQSAAAWLVRQHSPVH